MDWRQYEPPSAVTKRVGARVASRPVWDQMNPSPLVPLLSGTVGLGSRRNPPDGCLWGKD